VTGRPEIGLSGAALLETGLSALERGDIPAAVGALGALDEVTWYVVLSRFPGLDTYIRVLIAQAWTDGRR
jgi:hypothetical protein